MPARRFVAALVLAVVATACGKKGPPLTPFVLTPAAPTLDAPRRVGDDLVLQVTVPGANLDGSTPAVVSRVDVFGATALTPPPRARFLEIAELVATIPVAPAGEPGDVVLPAADPSKGVIQGSAAAVRDTLSDAERVPRELAPTPAERERLATAAGPPLPPPPTQLRRFYMAIAYNPRNRPGPPSAVVEAPVTVLPPAPSRLQAAFGELGVTLQWEPSGDLIGFLLDRALPPEEEPAPIAVRTAAAKPPPAPVDWLPGPTRYNVYREVGADPLALPTAGPGPAWRVTLAAPLNPAPLATLRFDDPVPPDGRERCYAVRAVRGGVEGPPSPRECVRTVDIVSPATPTNLATITAAGAINLIWDPNVDADLGGYVVLRSQDGGATLLPLTPSPIAVNRFTDRDVAAGVQYTYEVRAVDMRVPVPNTSEPARVTETAR